jgi:hypothetical protein
MRSFTLNLYFVHGALCIATVKSLIKFSIKKEGLFLTIKSKLQSVT